MGLKLKIEISVLVAVCVALFVTAIVVVSGVGNRNANHKTEELLGYACSDLPTTLRALFNSAVMMQAASVVDKLDAAHPPSPVEMRKLAATTSLDEIYLVSNYGKVLSAIDPSVVGRDLTTIPSMIDFLSLVESPELSIEQPVRLSIADSKTEVSYGGFPKPDGSLVLCGFTAEHLRLNFMRSSADLMASWELGESGAYAIVDDATGKLVFDVPGYGEAGDPFVQIGDAAALKAEFDTDATHTGIIGGKPCHYRVFGCYGLRVVAFVTHDEFFASVKYMLWAVVVLLLLVFATVGAMFHRVVASNRAMTALSRMREAAEKQRHKDMVMAMSIQKHSLPTTFPPYPGHVDDFDIFAFMRPAKEVGGDFYDFYFVGKDRMALVVADVSGKGVPAAMFMMRAKTTIQGLLKGGASLVEAVSKASDRLCEGNLEDMFVTAWVGLCNLQTGEIEYVNAGHNPPIIRRADGSVEWVRPRSGLVLAAMEGAPYRSHKVTLQPGDGILIYTDGVTEAQDVTGALYGEDRLERLVGGIDAAKDTHQCCDEVLASLLSFAGAAEQADDITTLAFRLKRLLPPR